jgi:hypothetical protein
MWLACGSRGGKDDRHLLQRMVAVTSRQKWRRDTCARCGKLLDADNRGFGRLLYGRHGQGWSRKPKFHWLCKICTEKFPDWFSLKDRRQ